MRHKGGFPWKSFLKSVAVIAIPVALQNLLTTTGSMVDTMMIAPLGENAVGALGLCAQFTSLMFSCYWGFVGGGMLFFSQYWGAKDDDGIDRSYGITFTCMMVPGLLFCLMALLAPETVMRIYTDKASIQAIGISYLKIVGFAYPLQVWSMSMSALLRSTERVRVPLYAAIASVGTNIFLNWVFIYGHFGVPAMGVRGAALATVCAAAINAGAILVFALITKYPYLFHFNHHFKWNKFFLSEYFRKCFPIICNELLIGIGNMIISIVLGRQSEEAIAAVAVFRMLEGLVIGFLAGFPHASPVLLISCIAAVVRVLTWVQTDTYRAAGDAAYGTILEIVFMYAMLLPCVTLTGLYFKLPILTVFACCYIDEPIRFVLMQVHLYSGKWIKPVTDVGRAAMPAFFEKLAKKRAAEE
ncbi:MAG: polysaccharide biosynthesis C-terminal domain-containing protein [Clostridia bacterium]|nr:polysaccharide biosynthesis C-terminal domain-containing protein [Clostridia bacterium]